MSETHCQHHSPGGLVPQSTPPVSVDAGPVSTLSSSCLATTSSESGRCPAVAVVGPLSHVETTPADDDDETQLKSVVTAGNLTHHADGEIPRHQSDAVTSPAANQRSLEDEASSGRPSRDQSESESAAVEADDWLSSLTMPEMTQSQAASDKCVTS